MIDFIKSIKGIPCYDLQNALSTQGLSSKLCIKNYVDFDRPAYIKLKSASSLKYAKVEKKYLCSLFSLKF